MSEHTYKNCNGARLLTSLSASWFVSYLYYLKVDSSHLNWKKYIKRVSMFNNSYSYHKEWLQKILAMDAYNLSKNQMGIDGIEIKRMAKKILMIMEGN